MKDNQIWSTSVGRWCGIPVRVHVLLIFFLVLIFGTEWNTGFFAGTAVVTSVAIVLSVLAHEIAHVFAATSIGGRVDELVLTPWGGNSELTVPDKGYLPALAYLAGPFANLMLFLFGLTLIVQSEHSSFFQLINPFQPHIFRSTHWQVSIVEIATWVNFQLFVVNLIPCFPFDGAQILRSLIRGARIEMPKYRIETAIKLVGTAVALAMILLSFFYMQAELGSLRPAWMFMLIAGIALLYSARYSMIKETEEHEEPWQEFDELEYTPSLYEASMYLDATDQSQNIAYSQWLSEKQEERRQQEIMLEQEEDERADEILQKLHSNGGDLGCLSSDERTILDRFSERIRRRRQQSV